MSINAQTYLEQLKQLIPQGYAWQAKDIAETVLHRLLQALTIEPARVDDRVDNLLDEADPLTTIELLQDWETSRGLPNACVGAPSTIQERRNILLFRLRLIGRQDPAFYIDLAAALGFTITITEFTPWTVADPINLPMYGESWRFYWQVNAPLINEIWFRVGQSGVNEPLRAFGNKRLECLMNEVKPAHTQIIFAYT